MRTAVYQILWMDKVPPSAAVNEAVKLTRSGGFVGLSGFVNGLLRNVVRAQSSGNIPKPSNLGLKYSFPPWLADGLVKWLGQEGAEEFCANSHLPPPVTICANTLKTTAEDLAESLQSAEVNVTKSDTADLCLHLKNARNITSLDPYKKGHFFVMETGAYLAAKATLAEPGQKVIDLCAAPGGKSFAIAGMMQNTGQIISCDIYEHKLKLIKNMASHLGLNCIKVQENDATVHNPAWDNWADAVLLDAPCSGLGVIRKHPDIKYNKNLEDVYNLRKFQRELLKASVDYVKPGGVLVYSTCTITPMENEENVDWFLKNFPFTLEYSANHDGFFIARMRK